MCVSTTLNARLLAVGQISLLASLLLVSGCDNNRFELTKDAAGNTVRLDRKTGELALIADGQIKTLRDSAQVDAERKAALAGLEKFKSWKSIDVTPLGVRASLATSWRDGKIYYILSLGDLVEAKELDTWLELKDAKLEDMPKADPNRRDQILRSAMLRAPFTLAITDAKGFNLSSISIETPIRVVDDTSLAIRVEAKNATPMSEDEYRRVAGWTVRWH